jgi:FtsP/CotA-like multicopper oxidase with cupredoxin domain
MKISRSHALRDRIARDPLLALGAASLFVVLTAASQSASSDSIVEPRVFSSSGGVLDLLMVAKPKAVQTISFQPPGGGTPIHPTGWVYEVCPRPRAGNSCPAGATTAADYGGIRLAVRPGDVLKIRLVNQLPAMDPDKVKHGKESGQGNLFRNPTNLHTHGLIVAPRTPTANDPTYGDYVFVQIYNSANGMPETTHQHGSNVMDFVDYRIVIPADHPSGIYWFHPHVHGISLNQVSSGLAGIITIGDVHDYASNAPRRVRHLILKDMQVLAAGTLHYDYDKSPVKVTDGEVQNQQIADFCEPPDNGGPASRHGYCGGEPGSSSGNSFVNSRWYFTINGQVFPTIRVTAPDGEVWRLTNASAQVSYRLELVDDATNRPILMQLLAIDGASISIPRGTQAGTVMAMGGNKFTSAECSPGGGIMLPVCVSDLIMMPASRAEVWVTYRTPNGAVATPPPNATATLKQLSAPLGPAAERWPQLKLAQIKFAQSKPTKKTIEVVGAKMIASSGTTNALAAPLIGPSAAAACTPLVAGHHRRIFFGVVNPNDPNSPFGLGYEEVVDKTGTPVPGTQVPISAFDPSKTLICVPLEHGGATVHETWELINLSTETHNFHIHQTKFTVLGVTAMKQEESSATEILQDNVPVPYAIPNIAVVNDGQNGYCTIEQWRTNQCTATPIVLNIPFSQVGEFVFHCHILEHEDSGMMAKIQVTAGRG